MIQVIERFHKIMEYVADAPTHPRTVSELAGLLNISSPACANIIKTMVQLGYLESTGHRKGYLLGATPYVLTRKGPYMKHLADLASPLIENLVKDINELVVLVTESSGKRVELIKQEPDSMIQVRMQKSAEIENLFLTATGTLILAYKSENEFRSYWDEYKHYALDSAFHSDDYNTVRKKCSDIVKNGCVISAPELQDGDDEINKSCTMAFPVFEDGKLIAALGSRVPLFRFKGERRKQILSKIKQTAKSISELL